MTNTTTNRMKRLIADISEHGATPSRVKKIANALRAVTAERDAATARVAELEALNAAMLAVLQWYGENARLARLIHSEGDEGRALLAADGGKKAFAFLAKKESRDD